MERLYTVAEVAQATGSLPQDVRRLIASGDISIVRSGRSGRRVRVGQWQLDLLLSPQLREDTWVDLSPSSREET